MNQVSFTGRITRDPELFYSKEGTGITKFHLAVKRNFKGSNGTYEADFIPCVAFRKTAENIASYCCRGSLIAVNGRLQSRSFEKRIIRKCI
ncbi:MAG: single-stranded DNA-binding protein [Bacillaceae bacterium]|nr:single-stranded DNA-binding protein [Bacillaceae bacterium]